MRAVARGGGRRRLLGWIGCGAALAALPLRAAEPARVLAADWVSAQNLLALGVTPLAMPEIARYGALVVEPPVPRRTRELGLRPEPNLELIAALAPDLIVMNPELAPLEDRLARLAPVLRFEPQAFDGSDQIAQGAAALAGLAAALVRPEAARSLVAGFNRAAATLAERLAARPDPRLGAAGRSYVISLIDTQRALVFTPGGLVDAVLRRLGLANAWTMPGTAFGHLTITLDALTDAEAGIITLGYPERVRGAVAMGAPLLTSLPQLRAKRLICLPQVQFYGGLPSAARLVRLLGEALDA